jgi:predicted RNA-binding protein YlqC (UPF0109 family)
MENLVANIARALVEKPEDVSVTRTGDQLELRVAPSDVGSVIGRQGRTARSLRTIVGAAGSKKNQRLTLEIVE